MIMPIFFVKFSYVVNEVVYHKTAVVRASDPKVVKDKIVRFYIANNDLASAFSFDKISLSSFNLILV